MAERDKDEEKIRKLMEDVVEMRDKTHAAEWDALKGKLAEAVWKYAKRLDREGASECGVEIMETLKGVMENFSPDKGDCIHYINKSLKNLMCKRKEKMRVEAVRNGIKFPEQRIKNMKRLCESSGKDIGSPEVQEWIARAQGLPLERVRLLLQADIDCRVHSESQIGTDEEGCSLFNFYAGTDPDNEVEMMEELHSTSNCIQQIWMKSQKRSQDYLSALVTRQLLGEASRFVPDAKLVPALRQYVFCNENILEQYLKGRLPLQEEVAEQFGKGKTDASRKMRDFREKLSDSLKMKEPLSTWDSDSPISIQWQ